MKIRKQLDLKHAIEAELDTSLADYDVCRQIIEADALKIRLVKSTNDVEIDLDKEPVALFRGRDRLFLPMLVYYRELCRLDGCNDFQLGQIDELIGRVGNFANMNPDVMKQPGITRGA